MAELIRYEAARRALVEAVEFDEVMAIINVAEQAALYAKQANDNELIEKATEIRVRAQRRAGEMLTKARAAGDLRGRGNPQFSEPASFGPKEVGLTYDQSSRYQQLAAMPEEHFETAVATAKATAGEVTTAFMLRAAKTSAPTKRLTKADAERLRNLDEARARGVSMFTTYARLTLKALRSQTEFDATELALVSELSAALHQVSER